MSQWPTAYVVNLARAAGWQGDALAPAVAMALASSQGSDHYVSNVIGGPQNERRGLWALTADEAAPTAPQRLWHPQDNARAAYSRWASEGGTWGWHPVWWGQTYAPALAFAEAVIAGRLNPEVNPAPSWRDHVERVRAMAAALHGQLAARG